MIKYNYCKKINNHLFDEKISKNKMNNLILKYDLINKGIYKDYYINNLIINISEKNNINFYYINELNIKYEKPYLITEYEINNCEPFNFYNVDYIDKYKLYSNKDNKIFIYEYDNYFTIEFNDFMIKDFDI